MSKPRILILGKRGGILQWYEGLLAAQTSLPEFSIHGFAFNHNHWQERFFKKLLKLIGANTEHYTARLLAKKIQQIQPDIILIADLFYLDTSILKALQTAKPKATIYHWIGDFFDARLAHSKDIVDCYLFTDSTFIEDARKIGIEHSYYLPLAMNPSIFTLPPKNNARKKELLFIGAWSESRQQILEQIKFPVTVYGKGWGKLKSEHIHIHPYNISLTQVAKLYQEYRYVLNIINKQNTRIGINMRCFEVPASGAILITEYSSDLIRCFDTKNDLIYFLSYSEIEDKLKNTSIDPEIIYNKILLYHTYHNRLEEIINITLS